MYSFLGCLYYIYKFDKTEGNDERGEKIRDEALNITVTILLFSIVVITISNDKFHYFPVERYRDLFFGIVFAHSFIMFGAIQYLKNKM